jgi:adenylate cyclase
LHCKSQKASNRGNILSLLILIEDMVGHNDVNISMNGANFEGEDVQLLTDKIQERLSRAIKKRYQYESNLRAAQKFLLDFVNTKVPLVIMYADLVGSTKMSMSLPDRSMVTIIRAFSYEMSNIIISSGGYVLKYSGDAVIAFFPTNINKKSTLKIALERANLMIEAIEKGINPVLIQNNMPELEVKVGIDEGEDLVIQYGHDTTSLIDILGYTMNRTAKITSLSLPNGITIGQNVFVNLPLDMKQNYKEVRFDTEKWKYIDLRTGELYKLYSIIG